MYANTTLNSFGFKVQAKDKGWILTNIMLLKLVTCKYTQKTHIANYSRNHNVAKTPI